MIKKIVIGTTVLLLILLLLSLKSKDNGKKLTGAENGNKAAVSATDSKRTFLLGFTHWPPSFDAKEIESMYGFQKQNSDLSVYHQVEGVAWPEALAGGKYPKRLVDNWNFVKSHFPKGRPVYLALTPLNDSRTGLANYANEKSDQEALPAPWSGYALNQQEVKNAYLNYVEEAVNFFQPEFLAIDIESNVLLSKDPKKWNEFLDLHEYIYKTLKKKYPELVIFSTVQYEHLNATQADAFGKAKLQKAEVEKLLKNSDLFALSTYPYMSKIKPVRESYFDLALSLNKPIAIAETGYASKDFSVYGYKFEQSPEDQRQYFDVLFKAAAANNFKFIVNFAAFDYVKLLQSLPKPARELAGVWVYTGLKNSEGADKPAFMLWQNELVKQLE